MEGGGGAGGEGRGAGGLRARGLNTGTVSGMPPAFGVASTASWLCSLAARNGPGKLGVLPRSKH